MRKIQRDVEEIDTADFVENDLEARNKVKALREKYVQTENKADIHPAFTDISCQHEEVINKRLEFKNLKSVVDSKIVVWEGYVPPPPEPGCNWTLIIAIIVGIIIAITPFINQIMTKRNIRKMQKEQEEIARKQREEENRRLIENDSEIINIQ
jgi:hypothetical protein